MSLRLALTFTLGGALITAPLRAQIVDSASASISSIPAKATPVRTFGGPQVGDDAPDFTLPAATQYGLLRNLVSLSDLRGRTVVLAFFPGARTPGCSIQMQKYRDRYATLFGDPNVVVIGISVDADTTLANWAREENFPMLFATDAEGKAGSAYGAYDPQIKLDRRLLYVIDRAGKVAYTAKPFDISTETSYTELGEAVKKAQ